MKINQRLSHRRLAEELVERELVDADTLNDLLQSSSAGGPPLPDALVEASLLSDWELSRVVCELYNLPFLPVEIASPVPDALERLDPFFLVEHGLVPLARHGNLLTICMPAIVSADVLQRLSADSGYTLLPVVGTVTSNRRWLAENLAASSKSPEQLAEDAAWSALFDEADAAVLQDLGGDEDPGSAEAA